MPALPGNDAAPTATLAFHTVPAASPSLTHEFPLAGDDGNVRSAENDLFALPVLDLSTERLEEQDNLQWGGRLLAELSDAELAAAVRGMCAEPPAQQPAVRNQRNWLKLRVQWPQRHVHVHLRLDEVVLDWFRRDGPGFQARMNAVLRAYVDAQIEAEQRAR